MALQDDFVSLGYIRRPHGYKGALNASIKALGIDPASISKVFMGLNGSLVPFFLQKLEHKNNDTFIFWFDGINTELEAQKLVGKEVFISLKDLPKQKKQVFNPDQLVDFQVYNSNNIAVGIVIEVLKTAAHPLVKISYQNRQILIPIHPDFILDLNIKKRTIVLEIPEGLLNI